MIDVRKEFIISMNIKEARQAAHLTQKELSERLNIPKRTIESWEEGTRKPPEYVERLIIAEIERIKKTAF